MVVLHVSPHPDDECMGAPATLLALRDAGARIVNYACGLGRPADHERRRAELVEACRRGGLELRIADPPLALSRGDDLVAAERELTSRLASLCRALHPAIVVSSSPHDGHHAHELVGRAVRDALAGSGTAWWMWGIWADLPFPTLLTAFDAERLEELQHVLAAHAGEQARIDVARLLRARAEATASLATERVFGSGETSDPELAYAELLCEAIPGERGWRLGTPRRLDPKAPLCSPSGSGSDPIGPRQIGWWLEAESVHHRFRRISR